MSRVTGIGGIFLRAKDPKMGNKVELWQPPEGQ